MRPQTTCILTFTVLMGCADAPTSTTTSESMGIFDSETDDPVAPKLDVAEHDPEQPGCQKMDLIFVIDNSRSMSRWQENLTKSVPGFISTIETVLAGNDVHIMVVDTDVDPDPETCYKAVWESFDCNLWCSHNCGTGCSCQCMGSWCNENELLHCDEKLGAGRIKDHWGNHCGLPDRRHLALGEDPAEAHRFDCIAAVGIEGSPAERTALALLEAVGPLSEPGGCNHGFVRDDALLIVTIISDEDDKFSPGDPDEWHARLVELKAGDPTAVVMLGFVGDSDLEDGLCPDFDPNNSENSGAAPARRLRAWIEAFPFGAWSSVCAPDYSPFFTTAMNAITHACEVFVPPA